jgi:hypothetical protein
MEIRLSEELTIRQYLLGQLDPTAETTGILEERIFMDSDFAGMVDVIEDEIIEDYLEGALNEADRKAMEDHFLRPPERQEKLRLARLVNRNLESSVLSARPAGADAGAVPVHPAGRDGWGRNGLSKDASPALWQPSMRMWAELAACALLAFAMTYAFKAHQQLQATRAQSGRQLAAERERSLQFERQMQNLRQMAQPAIVMLNLSQPGVTRSDNSFSTLQIGPGTQRLHVEIVLQFVPRGPVDVRLENADKKPIWTANTQFAFRANDDARLLLDVPAQNLEPGDYKFVITQANGAGVTYSFGVVRP